MKHDFVHIFTIIPFFTFFTAALKIESQLIYLLMVLFSCKFAEYLLLHFFSWWSIKIHNACKFVDTRQVTTLYYNISTISSTIFEYSKHIANIEFIASLLFHLKAFTYCWNLSLACLHTQLKFRNDIGIFTMIQQNPQDSFKTLFKFFSEIVSQVFSFVCLSIIFAHLFVDIFFFGQKFIKRFTTVWF